jgi:hypothetical protein
MAARTITGTTNVIAVTNGSGVSGNPTITIDSAYVGQTSITTLGTITTGTWNGTVVDAAHGGTGINNSTRTLTVAANAGTISFTNASTTLTIAAGASVSGTNTGDQAGLTAGSSSVGFINYNGTTQTTGQFYGGTTDPSHTTRLNYDGNFYATTFYGVGTGLSGTASNLTAGFASGLSLSGSTIGAIPYQTAATTTGYLAATATAGKILLSGSNAAPTWSTATLSATALTFAGAGTINSTSATLTLDSVTSGNINIGTGAVAKTITIGNNTGATGVAITSGSGNVVITSPQVSISTDLVVSGNLTVNGTTTTINANTLSVDDKNIQLGNVISSTISTTGTVGSISGGGPWTATITGMTTVSGLIPGSTIAATNGTGSLGGGGVYVVATIVSSTSVTYTATGGTTPTAGTITTITTTDATDTTANGGGITLMGATNKTLTWDSATASWISSENWNLVTGKAYEINGASVLSASTLGSGVTASSLTSVGTLTGLTVMGSVGIGIASPLSPLHMWTTSSTLRGIISEAHHNNSTSGAFFQAQKSRDNSGANAAVISGDVLGTFVFAGYNGSAYSTGKAYILATTTEDWSTTRNGTTMSFYITPQGSTSPKIRLYLSDDSVEVADTAGMDGNTPATLEIRDALSSSSWSLGASFAKLAFTSSDSSYSFCTGNIPTSAIRASIDAYQVGSAGSSSGLRFKVTPSITRAAEDVAYLTSGGQLYLGLATTGQQIPGYSNQSTNARLIASDGDIEAFDSRTLGSETFSNTAVFSSGWTLTNGFSGTLAIATIVSTVTTLTVTFAAQLVAPYTAGAVVTISNTTNYNGSWTVVTCSTTGFTAAATVAYAQETSGNISGLYYTPSASSSTATTTAFAASPLANRWYALSYTVSSCSIPMPNFGPTNTPTITTTSGFVAVNVSWPLGAPITASTLNTGGSGYTAAQRVLVQGGNAGAQITINTVDGNGAVLTYTVTYPGDGYWITNIPYTLATIVSSSSTLTATFSSTQFAAPWYVGATVAITGTTNFDGIWTIATCSTTGFTAANATGSHAQETSGTATSVASTYYKDAGTGFTIDITGVSGTNTIYIKSATTTPTSFRFNMATNTMGSVVITGVSLKEIQSGNVVAQGLFTGGGTTGLKVDTNGIVSIMSAAYSVTRTSNNEMLRVGTRSNTVLLIDTFATTSSSVNRPNLFFRKSHVATFDSYATTIDTEELGAINWFGVDGQSTPAQARAASFKVIQNGTAGGSSSTPGYIPSDMLFSLSPGGTADITELFRLTGLAPTAATFSTTGLSAAAATTISLATTTTGTATTINIGTAATTANKTINIGTTTGAGTNAINIGTAITSASSINIGTASYTTTNILGTFQIAGYTLGMGASLTLPTLGAIGDIPYATSTTALGVITAVATGSILTSAGTGTVPAWSASPTLTTSLTVPTLLPAASSTAVALYNTVLTTGTVSIAGAMTTGQVNIANGATALGTSQTTTAVNILSGAMTVTTSGTRTVNVGVNGGANLTTNINIGSTNLGTTTINSPTAQVQGTFTVKGTTQARGAFDGGSTAPSHTDRMNYDGNFYATNLYGITSLTVPTIYGSATTANNLTLRANSADTTTGSVAITTSTAATSATTGALTVAGGLGLSGDLYMKPTVITSGTSYTSTFSGMALIILVSGGGGGAGAGGKTAVAGATGGGAGGDAGTMGMVITYLINGAVYPITIGTAGGGGSGGLNTGGAGSAGNPGLATSWTAVTAAGGGSGGGSSLGVTSAIATSGGQSQTSGGCGGSATVGSAIGAVTPASFSNASPIMLYQYNGGGSAASTTGHSSGGGSGGTVTSVGNSSTTYTGAAAVSITTGMSSGAGGAGINANPGAGGGGGGAAGWIPYVGYASYPTAGSGTTGGGTTPGSPGAGGIGFGSGGGGGGGVAGSATAAIGGAGGGGAAGCIVIYRLGASG